MRRNYNCVADRQNCCRRQCVRKVLTTEKVRNSSALLTRRGHGALLIVLDMNSKTTQLAPVARNLSNVFFDPDRRGTTSGEWNKNPLCHLRLSRATRQEELDLPETLNPPPARRR